MTDPYSVGTVSVSNGGTTVTGTGTFWVGKVRKNDMFFDPAQGLQARVTADPTDNEELTITAWAGTALSDDAYEIIPAADSTSNTARLRDLLAQMSVVEANGRGLFYRFSDTTTDADPGAGYLRLNNADLTLVTAAYIDVLDANGATVSGEVDTWDDSTSLGKGNLWVRSIADPSAFRAYAVTGSIVDGTGYRKLTLTHVGGSGSFAADDELMVAFARTGDTGEGYVTDATVADPSELTALEGEDAGYLVFVTDLQTDFGAYSGRSGVVELVAGPDWQLVAIYTGPQGVQGPQGEQGEQGEQGPPGLNGEGTVASVVAGDGIAVDSTDPTAPVVSALVQGSVLQGANIYQITGNLKHKGLTVQIFPTTVSDGPGSQGNKKWVIVWREGIAHGYDGDSVIKAADSYDQGKSLQNIRTIYDEATVDARDFSGATMDGGRIGMLVTRELGTSSYGKPMFLYSDDDGVTWTSSVLAAMADGLSFDEYLHNIPAGLGGGSDSWIAYGWVNPTRTTIQYARTDDNGATWSSGTAVATVSGEDWSEPRVARLGSEDQWIMVIRRNQSEGLNAFISKSSDMLTWSVPVDSGQEVGRNCMTLLAQGNDLHWFVFSRPYATEAMSIDGRRDSLLVQSRRIDEVWADLDDWAGWETFATMFRPLGYMKFLEDSGKTYGIFAYNEYEVGDGASYTALAILTDDPTFSQLGSMSGGGSNGNWIAYPDGRLECYGTITTTITCTAYAGLFLSEGKDLAYPCNAAIKFASQPATQVRVRTSSARAWPTAAGDPLDQVLYLSQQFLSPVATTAQSLTFDYHAVGKWS